MTNYFDFCQIIFQIFIRKEIVNIHFFDKKSRLSSYSTYLSICGIIKFMICFSLII